MLFQIDHTTLYTYSEPVALGPHVIRLRPRADGSQRLLAHALRIEPEPIRVADCLDLEGNIVTHAWFSGITERLRVISVFTVETLRHNPFDYLLADDLVRLPAGQGNAARWTHYVDDGIVDPAVRAFSHDLAERTDHAPLAFLNALNEAVHDHCKHEIRPDGKPQDPATTLAIRTGACRDLTVLFMAAARTQGFATRFVSGYWKGHPERDRRYLHAWPEVYLPGGGWRGYDPTHGLAVADQHVALAAARAPEDTMPIEGTFAGAAASSTMDFALTIRVV